VLTGSSFAVPEAGCAWRATSGQLAIIEDPDIALTIFACASWPISTAGTATAQLARRTDLRGAYAAAAAATAFAF
jgi:hypothetical protein